MNLWGRRIVVFLVVFATGLSLAYRARRATAHASVQVSSMPMATAANASPGPVPSADSGKNSEQAEAPPRIAPSATLPAPSAYVSGPSRAAVTKAGAGSAGAGATAGSGAMRTFHDRSYKVSFDYPANWTFADKDHQISTFRLDARSADKKTQLRAVTALPENPYPASTFTGAYVYLSVTPHTNEQKCAAQASAAKSGSPDLSRIAGLRFVHGHDEQKHICTVERDEIYTTYRKGACYRFDLAMNNFCGGEVSGVKDVTEQELDTVLARMESIMGTVRFDPK